MKSVLITGGAGFIGFHVAKQLLSEGKHVVIIDNFNDFYSPELKHDRIAQLQPTKRLHVHSIDIMDMPKLNRLFKKYAFSTICHLAAQANISYSLKNPFRYDQWNTTGTLNILEQARKNHIQNIVIASSSSVYGLNPKSSFLETNSTDQPLSFYAATKKATEMYAHVYHHLHGLQCTLLRFFTAYGPWGRPDMALFQFTKNILSNREITLYNAGESLRDFTYIDDITQGICQSLKQPHDFEIYNLGNHRPVKIITLVRLLETLLGKKAKIKFQPLRKEDLPHTNANIKKAKQQLNFAPTTSLKQGVSQFLQWYLEYYKQ